MLLDCFELSVRVLTSPGRINQHRRTVVAALLQSLCMFCICEVRFMENIQAWQCFPQSGCCSLTFECDGGVLIEIQCCWCVLGVSLAC